MLFIAYLSGQLGQGLYSVGLLLFPPPSPNISYFYPMLKNVFHNIPNCYSKPLLLAWILLRAPLRSLLSASVYVIAGQESYGVRASPVPPDRPRGLNGIHWAETLF